MAFTIRAEFWSLADASDAMGAPLLREAIADAVEFDEDVSNVALPTLSNRAAYVMIVTALNGSATVAVNGDAPARGRLVKAGSEHLFQVEPDSTVSVAEYA